VSKVVLFQPLPGDIEQRQSCKWCYQHTALLLEPPAKDGRGPLLERAIAQFRQEFPFAWAIAIHSFPNITVWYDEKRNKDKWRARFAEWTSMGGSVEKLRRRPTNCWSDNPWAEESELIIEDRSAEPRPPNVAAWISTFARRMQMLALQSEAYGCNCEVVMPYWTERTDIQAISGALVKVGYKSRFSAGPLHWTLRELEEVGCQGGFKSAEEDARASPGPQVHPIFFGDSPTALRLDLQVTPFEPSAEMLALACEYLGVYPQSTNPPARVRPLFLAADLSQEPEPENASAWIYALCVLIRRCYDRNRPEGTAQAKVGIVLPPWCSQRQHLPLFSKLLKAQRLSSTFTARTEGYRLTEIQDFEAGDPTPELALPNEEAVEHFLESLTSATKLLD
jgi:hypothetical protein